MSFPIKMGIFRSYVSLPEGRLVFIWLSRTQSYIFLAFPRPMNLHDRLLQGLPIDCDPFKMLAGSADWFYLVTCVLLLKQDAGPPPFFIPFTFTMF